jgi:hypothetical protein
LEHIDEEELSEEERKAAWANYNQQMSMERSRQGEGQGLTDAAGGEGGVALTKPSISPAPANN